VKPRNAQAGGWQGARRFRNDCLGFPNVVQEQREVEQGGIAAFVEGGPILERDGFGFGKHAVEFTDGVQRMNIGGVAVVIFVLHEARQSVEVGDEAAKHAEFVHLFESGMHGSDFGKDRAEAHAGVVRARNLRRQSRQRSPDELGEVEVEGNVELLAVTEDAQESHRVVDEHIGSFRGELAATEEEPVEALRPCEPRGPQALAERAAAFAVGTTAADTERESIFDEL
jgi:hypothetical protein